MITTIFVDVDDTLLDFNECSKESMIKAFGRHGLEFRDEYFPVFLEENDRLWKMIEKKEITLADIYRTRWNAVLKRIGLEGDGPAIESSFVEALYESHIRVEGALEMIEYLHDRYDLYVTSNAPEAEQLNRLEKAGLLQYFKGVFTSEKIGVAKPDVRFFEECLRLSSSEKDSTVVVGDSLSSDIAGADSSGLRSVWFNRKNRSVPENYSGFVIYSLKEIKEVL